MKPITLLSIIACLLITAMPCVAGSETNETPGIREFDLETIEELGRNIYERDMYAARATDILLKEVGKPEKLEEEKIRGWVVRQRKKTVLVRFIKQVGEGFAPAYDITFPSPGSTGSHDEGVLTKAAGTLSPDESAQFKARQLALKNIPEPFSRRYNTIVLPDVDGKGFLVYAIAATMEPDLILIGGHYRMTVSSDGEKVERVDRLFKDFLVVSKSDVPKDKEVAGLGVSHVVSNMPVETHVFVSMLHNQLLFVVTEGGQLWEIDKGTITKRGKMPSRETDGDKK